MVRLLNDLTGGQLLPLKIILASMVFTLSGLQVLLAARLYEASTVPPISAGIAGRMQGVVVVLAAGVEDPTKAAAATPAATVTSGGPGGGITIFVLVTAVLAAFLGGIGLSAFASRRAAAAR